MIPLVPLLAASSVAAFVWYAITDEVSGKKGSSAKSPPKQISQKRSWLMHPDVHAISNMGDHVLVTTTTGSTPDGLPLTSPDGRPVYVEKGGPIVAEDAVQGNRKLTPYIQVVNQVLGELKRHPEATVKHGFNLFKQRTETAISAPTELVGPVRIIVNRAMERYKLNPGTVVEERTHDGWQIVLIETK